jgi:hypothetical protein
MRQLRPERRICRYLNGKCSSDRRVTATTLVLTHNLLGRVYLAIILPFHRLIVPAMLRQVAG